MKILVVVLVLATAAPMGARPSVPRPNACQLLTPADVSAVQGERFIAAKRSERGKTSQCFYQLPTFVKSISVDFTSTGGREFWQEHFEHRGDSEREKERREARGKESIERSGKEEKELSVPIRGLGDDAIWAGSHVGGSLYVRQGDSFLRISVGGPGKEKQKINRSRRLAVRALRRL